jgi:hypothetical protein
VRGTRRGVPSLAIPAAPNPPRALLLYGPPPPALGTWQEGRCEQALKLILDVLA